MVYWHKVIPIVAAGLLQMKQLRLRSKLSVEDVFARLQWTTRLSSRTEAFNWTQGPASQARSPSVTGAARVTSPASIIINLMRIRTP